MTFNRFYELICESKTASWLDPSGKFHNLKIGQTHTKFAFDKLGNTNAEHPVIILMKKGWQRVTWLGSVLLSHNDFTIPNNIQQRKLKSMAWEENFEKLEWDGGEDSRILWTQNDVLQEQQSFASLPDNAPYGFWIYPNGDFEIVTRNQGHNYVAIDIIEEHPKLRIEFKKSKKPADDFFSGDGDRAFRFLYSKGFARVVNENDTMHFACAKATNTQRRTVKDLADFYGKTVYEDRR